MPRDYRTESSPRRILFVVEKLADRSGGAERILIETANSLAARGHQVEIVSHEFRRKPPFYRLSFGVVHTNLRPPRENRGALRSYIDGHREEFQAEAWYRFPFDRLTWFSRHGGFWRRLERYLAAHRPDVAIAFMPPAITALALADPGYPLRKVASTHNNPEQDFHNPARWDPNPLDRKRRFEAMRALDLIMVLLPEYADWYPEELRDRVAVVPNAVHPVDPVLLPAERQSKIVMSVGRLAPVKRHGMLIEAWARLAADFPDWSLHIYGIGQLKAELAEQIAMLGLESRVRLMGHTRRILDRYLEAEILAHPAEYEGFPLAVTEGLAAGLPVVGFADCSGLNRLVLPGRNGLLVPAEGERVANLAAALGGLMHDADLRRRMGQFARESVSQYTPDKVIDLWEDFLATNAAQDAPVVAQARGG